MGTSHENCLAAVLIPAVLFDNQHSASFEEDDQCEQIARAILSAQQVKAHNLFFCETCIELIV